MKLFTRTYLCLVLAVFLVTAVNEVSAQTKYPRASQKASVMQTVGDTDVTITYHRPNAKGRTLWGGKADKALVPAGEVWRTGANEATVFEVTNDVMINGQKLEKGKYSFYAIPGTSEWTLIFNKTWDQWGTIYDEKKDALRVAVKPMMDESSVESLAFMIHNVTANSADVVLAWGKTRIPFKLDIGDVSARLLNSAQRSIVTEKLSAANYVFSTKQKDKYKDALGWLDSVLAEREIYGAMFIKARLLAEMGMKGEAVKTAEKAISFGKANKANPRSIGFLTNLMKGWKGE